jgi:hypothetical protein
VTHCRSVPLKKSARGMVVGDSALRFKDAPGRATREVKVILCGMASAVSPAAVLKRTTRPRVRRASICRAKATHDRVEDVSVIKH